MAFTVPLLLLVEWMLTIMKYIDLSQTIKQDMPVYPGDAKVSLVQKKCFETDYYNAYSLSTGMHAGTHIDCPMHLTKNNRTISEYPLESFSGPGCLIDARAEREIGYREEYAGKIRFGDIVLILTGTDMLYGSDQYYFDHPVITEGLASFFASKGIRMLGVDMPSPDFSPFAVHKILLSEGIFIMENLTNLDQLIGAGCFEVYAAPLKINAEASLVRAFARYK